MRYLLLLFLLLGVLGTGEESQAQRGHRISFQIDGYEADTLYLAYYLMDKQYIRDTVGVDANGRFVFAGEDPLEPGVYLAVMAPDNRVFQLLITPEEQHFDFVTQVDEQVGRTRIEGSPDNALFYEYLGFLQQQTARAQPLRAALQENADDANARQQLDALSAEVGAFQEQLIAEHPQTMTAAIVRANLAVQPPDFGPGQEGQEKAWRWMQRHYFDNLDLRDDRLLRTPFLFERLDYFVHKLHVQHPDTIALAIDKVLQQMDPASETFKVYLIHFLNEAAASKIIGMDAVYVHLVDNYYAKGLAPWAEEESLAKMLERATALRPLLIGKVAPDIRMQRRDGTPVSLHEVDAEYTILYFWRYDCGHCKKSTPFMKAFWEQYKDKDVKIFSVCTKHTDEVADCWKYVDDNELGEWVQVVDPYLRSRYNKIYDVQTTPQIFVLDKDKVILSKRLGAEQLPEVLDMLMERAEAGR
jgi:hypothetical protein